MSVIFGEKLHSFSGSPFHGQHLGILGSIVHFMGDISGLGNFGNRRFHQEL
jgi:hypothetical protein